MLRDGKRFRRTPDSLGKYLDSDEKVESFLDEIEAVCVKHGISISHEDGHGAFIIEDFNESNIQWLRAASDERK